MTALTCQLGAVTLRLTSTSTPGVVECQRYRGARPLGGLSRVSLGDITRKPELCVVEGDLSTFGAAVASGIEDDPFAGIGP